MEKPQALSQAEFEQRFRSIFFRDMTPEERKFFVQAELMVPDNPEEFAVAEDEAHAA